LYRVIRLIKKNTDKLFQHSSNLRELNSNFVTRNCTSVSVDSSVYLLWICFRM